MNLNSNKFYPCKYDCFNMIYLWIWYWRQYITTNIEGKQHQSTSAMLPNRGSSCLLKFDTSNYYHTWGRVGQYFKTPVSPKVLLCPYSLVHHKGSKSDDFGTQREPIELKYNTMWWHPGKIFMTTLLIHQIPVKTYNALRPERWWQCSEHW